MDRVRSIITAYDKLGWDWLLVVEAAAHMANREVPASIRDEALEHNRKLIHEAP